MAENSKIEWTDHTFNPWVGCTKVSPGCDHCYAETWAKRTGGAALWQGERRRTSEANWRQPLKWDRQAKAAGKRFRVFCASLADVFDNQVPPEWRADLFDLIKVTPHLDWLLLTKRPQNIAKMLPPGWGTGWPNVWLGTTVENQTEADRRIPHLLNVPATVRFLSMEPLLGPVDLDVAWHGKSALYNECWGDCGWCQEGLPPLHNCQQGNGEWWKDRSGIDWVIVGGESGPGARPMHPDWARSLRDQCKAAGVPFHFKQWGEWAPQVGAVDGWNIDNDPEISRFDHRDWDGDRWGEAYRPMWCDDRDDDTVSRIGKARAGRLLDGVEHNGLPEMRP